MAHTIVQGRHEARVESSATGEDAGKLLLRLVVGGLMLLHGIAKLTNGVDGIEGMLEKHGLPGVLAYGAYIGEVIAPLFVIVGLFTRPAALMMAVNMLFAIGLAHANDIRRRFVDRKVTTELQGFYLFGAFAIALLGAGRLSFGGSNGHWN